MGVNAGTGPGEITPDGCSVDFYDLLPVMGEPEIVHAAAGEHASIIELGCGTGRILRPLAGFGHPVLGVDESAAMLARVPELPTVCSGIEDLRLDETFDVVLLASTMINTDPGQRRRFLATCCRHVAADGIVVIQQNSPAWFAALGPSEQETGGIRRIIRSADRTGARVDVLVEYQVGDRTWTHAWSPHEIGEEELVADLASAGLAFDRWLTDDHSWFTARPV
jgi:SAM-dependent methyltransferase